MDLLLWLVVVLIPVAQVPGVLLLARYAGGEEQGWQPGYAHHVVEDEAAADGVARCRRCGARNDAAFARCARCAAPLAGR